LDEPKTFLEREVLLIRGKTSSSEAEPLLLMSNSDRARWREDCRGMEEGDPGVVIVLEWFILIVLVIRYFWGDYIMFQRIAEITMCNRMIGF
jgi:hypothetical protein